MLAQLFKLSAFASSFLGASPSLSVSGPFGACFQVSFAGAGRYFSAYRLASLARFRGLSVRSRRRGGVVVVLVSVL